MLQTEAVNLSTDQGAETADQDERSTLLFACDSYRWQSHVTAACDSYSQWFHVAVTYD